MEEKSANDEPANNIWESSNRRAGKTFGRRKQTNLNVLTVRKNKKAGVQCAFRLGAERIVLNECRFIFAVCLFVLYLQ